MTPQQLSYIAQSIIACIVLLWMLLSCLPALRLDIFRQQMFAIRDELFDYAAAGNVAFDHPAYTLLRKSMNGFIRYGHRLSFFQLMITLCRWHFSDEKPVSRWQKQWEPALATIDNGDVKMKLGEFHTRSMGLVIGRIVSGSPVILTAIAFVALAALCRGAWKSTAELYYVAAEKTLRAFSIHPDALEDEALRSASHS
jgi:hypothetical protein